MSESANDPTRAGSEPPEWGADVMWLSISEITALALKAARGAGWSWGEAEEASWACGWLARAGLPGPAMMLRVLERGPAVSMCPLRTGIMLMDHAGLPEGPGGLPVVLHDVVEPLMLLPFLARVAERTGTAVALDLGAHHMRVSGAGAVPDLRDLSALCGADAPEVSVSLTQAEETIAPGIFDGRIARRTWVALDALALKTTVPASDLSRQRAGAQSSDND